MWRSKTRRQALKMAGASISVGLLAGCSGQGEEETTENTPSGSEGDGSDTQTDTPTEDNGEAPGANAGFLEDGQEVNLLIPASPGGGFDSYSRALAPVFERKISDIYGVDVSLAPENNAGGGTIPATNQHANTEPSDGTSIFMIHGTLAPTNQVILSDQVAYNVRDLVYVGQIAYNVKCIVSRADDGASNWEEAVEMAQGGTMDVAADGRGATTHLGFSLIGEGTDEFDVEFIFYEAATEAMNGVIRGDGDYTLVNYSSGISNVQEDNLQYVVAMNDEQPTDDGIEMQLASEADVPNWQTIRDLVNTIRGFTLPPGTDEEAAAAWRHILEQSVQDEEFLQWAEENSRPVMWADHDAMREKTLNVLESVQEREDFLGEILEE